MWQVWPVSLQCHGMAGSARLHSFVQGLQHDSTKEIASDSDSDDSSSPWDEPDAVAAAPGAANPAHGPSFGWGSGCSGNSNSSSNGGGKPRKGQWQSPRVVGSLHFLVGLLVQGLPLSGNQQAGQSEQETAAALHTGKQR